VSTPSASYHYESIKVEEALKREVGTPHKVCTILFFQVEEALKREVGTPLTNE
jgi:hypothetical protein